MYVEDLLVAIKSRLNHTRLTTIPRPFDGRLDDPWHQDFIRSIAQHIAQQKSLSTNQAQAILRLIARVRPQLVHNGMATDDELDELQIRPQYRQPLYESFNIPREVRHLGDNLLGFRFKQNDQIVERIKACSQPIVGDWLSVTVLAKTERLNKPYFDGDYRLWVVPVTRSNMRTLATLINEYRFGLDDATLTYLRLAMASVNQPSTIVLATETGVMLANVRDNPLLAGWLVAVAEGVVL
jgi:hypothetical protein